MAKNDTTKKILYAITADGYPRHIKIGIGDDAKKRFKNGETWHPIGNLHLRAEIPLKNAEKVERAAISLHGDSATAGGEWLKISPQAFKKFILDNGECHRKGGIEKAMSDPFWGGDPHEFDEIPAPVVKEKPLCIVCKKVHPTSGYKTCDACLKYNREKDLRWRAKELAKGKDGFFADKFKDEEDKNVDTNAD